MYLASLSDQFLKPQPPSKNPLNLLTSDIPGAFIPEQRFHPKPSFSNRADDILGATLAGKPIGRQVDRTLMVHDIEGARPTLKNVFQTRRSTNPLMPVYYLPTIQPVEPEQPKFIRNSLIIADIDGSAPVQHIKKYRPKEEFVDSMKKKVQPRLFGPMNVSDINAIDKPSARKEPYIPEIVEGSYSRQLHPSASTKTSLYLTNNDI